jgi:hypothetical protein
MATVQKVTRGQLAEHLRGVRVRRPVLWVVEHHTWRPTAAQYRGRSTIWGVTRYHTQVRGWSDNGYHIMIGPDGAIWLCRPIRRSGGHCRARNYDSVGISVVLNGDREQFWSTPQHAALVAVTAMVCARFDIDPRTHIGPHARWSSKTCPGLRITDQWQRLLREVLVFMANGIVGTPVKVLGPDGEEVDCEARLEGSKTRANLREVCEAAGIGVTWNAEEHAVQLRAPGGADTDDE